MNRIERAIEKIVLNSRWLVAPFLLGLIVGLAALLYAFIVKLGDFVLHVRGARGRNHRRRSQAGRPCAHRQSAADRGLLRL